MFKRAMVLAILLTPLVALGSVGELGLRWNEVTEFPNGDATFVTQYTVYWKLADAAWDTPSQSFTYADDVCTNEICEVVISGLPVMVQIDLVVHAANIGGESGPSNIFRTTVVVPPPPAPTGLTIFIP